MRAFATVLVVVLASASAGAAQPAPAAVPSPAKPAPKPLDKLFADLRRAETPEDAKTIESQILASFLASGSASIDLLMGRADAALALGNKDVAGKLYNSVTALAPSYAEGWHRKAVAQADAGQDAAAMISMQKAVQLNPRHFEAMVQLGLMLEDYGDKPGALKLYRKALALDPHYDGLSRKIDGLSRDVEGQGI